MSTTISKEPTFVIATRRSGDTWAEQLCVRVNYALALKSHHGESISLEDYSPYIMPVNGAMCYMLADKAIDWIEDCLLRCDDAEEAAELEHKLLVINAARDAFKAGRFND